MSKLIALSLLILVVGCGVKNSRPQSVVAQTQSVPQSTPSKVYEFPQLTPSQSRFLDRQLPKSARQILEQSQELELFSIKPCELSLNSNLSLAALEGNNPNQFQGCQILKRVVITDAQLKRKLLDALYYGIGAPDSTAACFSPRHGIRAIINGAKVELVVCFQCHNFRGAAKSGTFGGGISNVPQEFFNSILSENAGN
jgi:hypothetical protein